MCCKSENICVKSLIMFGELENSSKHTHTHTHTHTHIASRDNLQIIRFFTIS